MAGFVYIAVNEAFPNIVKIGFTTKEPTERLDELARPTGVPGKYELHNGAEFSEESHARNVERLLHKAFHPKRFGNDREFFQIKPEEAMDALRLFIPGGKELKKRRRNSGQSRSRTKNAQGKIATPSANTEVGWKAEVLDRIERLKKREFTNQDFYSLFSKELSNLHPDSRNVEAAIRTQFQALGRVDILIQWKYVKT